MAKERAVFGIYATRAAAEKAVDQLKEDGFRNEDVSVLLSSKADTKEFATESSTKLPEGTTAGAVTGASIGGVLGWLAGIGSLAIPGVGPFIAAGPIMGALAGVGLGGTVGGLTGGLIGLGIPEHEAVLYEGRIKDGGVLVSVHADNFEWADKAKRILDRTGAENVSSKAKSLDN